jgi:hypothetical protein
MPGGLLQLVGRGAQDQLVTGNPSFTHFRSVYKRHTDFAMEHFRLYFKTSLLSFPTSGTLRLRTKVERYAQLINDCYLSIDIPNIYSPVVPLASPVGAIPASEETVNSNSDAIGYEFQWIRNLGYNMIRHVSLLINGQEIVRHTGEWMKLYANLTFDANKKAILDRMIGNVPELYDPANANGRFNQYPHSISSTTTPAEPAIYGRTLMIPLHFWFCETVGQALPLVALQQSEVEIVVELQNAYSLFTVRDVRKSKSASEYEANVNFGKRIAPDTSNNIFSLSHYLSPPLYSNPAANLVPGLTSWNFNPFVEGNYIFLGDAELAYVARNEHSFMISQIDMVQADGQYGPSNDTELTMKNLISRIVWVGQRTDRFLQNDFDNYTNWEDPYKSPIASSGLGWYTSGTSQEANISQRDILLESTLVLDGQERFAPKQTLFFTGMELYRHQTGNPIPGVYEYSFALDNDPIQPSGSINGSMFNKTIMRNTYVLPPLSPNLADGTDIITQCVLKSTAGSKNPVVILNPNIRDANGKLIYGPEDVVTIVTTRVPNEPKYLYTYTVRTYVQSYNFLRIMAGLGNVVFSS